MPHRQMVCSVSGTDTEAITCDTQWHVTCDIFDAPFTKLHLNNIRRVAFALALEHKLTHGRMHALADAERKSKHEARLFYKILRTKDVRESGECGW